MTPERVVFGSQYTLLGLLVFEVERRGSLWSWRARSLDGRVLVQSALRTSQQRATNAAVRWAERASVNVA